MHTHVYANDQEIASKAVGGDGASNSAFPDPCWSPPAPSAGPVVISYPNSCKATHITNGTATVFICGKEVARADQSYFSTSTGNEGATQAFAKGFATGVITGKAYFAQWSSDVVFEGFGVPRHQDMVSHNHGSMPSNTPLFPYISRGWFSHDCSAEEKKIERACKPESENSDSKKELKKQSKLAALLKKLKGKKPVGRRGKDGKHWTDDHCGGLHFSLDSASAAQEYAKEMQDVFNKIPDELNLLGALENELKDMAVRAGTKAAGKFLLKAGAKQLGGSTIPLAGNIAMGLWSVYDAAVAIGDVGEIKAVATETLEQLDMLKNKFGDIQKLAKEFENFKNLPLAEQAEKAQALGAEGQDLLATLNDCTRARKCNLVPYGADGAGNLLGQNKNSKVESAKGGGCCNGQTGHHLIPGGSVKETCPNYDHATAPTVCVEGTSQNHGSHKRVHEALAQAHQAKKKLGKVAADGTMSMDDAIDAAADSHKEAFPLSRCSKKCIKAQLAAYYAICRGSRAKAVNSQAKPLGPTGNGPT
jgi:hypothetical protein